MAEQEKLGIIDLTVVVLTLYVLGSLVVDTFVKLPPETSLLLLYFDHAICAFFFIEFVYRFSKAENKWKFMRWGWIDLLASVPMIEAFRAGRILRLIRLLRVIRAFRTTQHLIHHIFKNKIQGALSSLSILAVLVIIFSSIAILQVEHDPRSNIKTAEDAIWWTYTTVTTVGYGDKYPVTTEGRILAMALMTFGVGIFGTFTAYIASIFVSEKSKADREKQ